MLIVYVWKHSDDSPDHAEIQSQPPYLQPRCSEPCPRARPTCPEPASRWTTRPIASKLTSAFGSSKLPTRSAGAACSDRARALTGAILDGSPSACPRGDGALRGEVCDRRLEPGDEGRAHGSQPDRMCFWLTALSNLAPPRLGQCQASSPDRASACGTYHGEVPHHKPVPA